MHPIKPLANWSEKWYPPQRRFPDRGLKQTSSKMILMLLTPQRRFPDRGLKHRPEGSRCPSLKLSSMGVFVFLLTLRI
jgi:hypothetical protein